MDYRDFAVRQPGYPSEGKHSEWYYRIAEALEGVVADRWADLDADLRMEVALTLTDYLQDIVADGGLWRGFVDENRRLYGWSVPFHEIPENYVDFELNREDVRFLVWYAVAMLSEELRDLYPHDERVFRTADRCYELLATVYEDAPAEHDWRLGLGLEMDCADDRPELLKLGRWLYTASYLLTPAATQDLRDGLAETELVDYPTGPLALFVPEWISLVVAGQVPDEPKAEGEEHKFYRQFTDATGGERVRFFDSYESMNRFFIEQMGWEAGKEHLAQAKGADDYALMVDPHRGMLMARNVARCIAAPGNAMYDPEYAHKHAFELMTRRGACPADLVRYSLEHGWLPDAVFPGTTDTRLVQDNADFIARCYLQMYYRD